jgi:hypothetical protein
MSYCSPDPWCHPLKYTVCLQADKMRVHVFDVGVAFILMLNSKNAKTYMILEK